MAGSRAKAGTAEESKAKWEAQMRRVVVALVVLFALALAAPAVAHGDQPVVVVPQSFDLAAGQPVTVQVVEPRAQYSSVCFNFVFGADALDPGEEIDIGIRSAGEIGFFNPTTAPQTSRTLCITSEYQPDLVAAFDDGHEAITLSMPAGSVTVSSFTVSLS
jgi:hypothetical protein